MDGWLRQSTAVTVNLPPAVDSTTPEDSETSLTISQADIRLSKAGGDLAQKNESSAATHDEIGVYKVAFDTTDTNTLGSLDLYVKETGVLHLWKSWTVVPAHIYDAFVNGTDAIDYAEGAVWLDTNNGNSANSGTARKPMDTIANALTKLSSTGLSRLAIVNDQTVTLGASISAKEIFGFGRRGIVNFNGQDISECTIRNLLVYGDTLAASGPAEFVDCVVGSGSYATLYARNCRLSGTVGITGNAYLVNCTDEGSYTGTPDLDFETPGSTRRAVMTGYHGRIEVKNMNSNAGLLLTGIGQLTIAATCSAGAITVMGLWDVVDNASGAVTVSTIVDETIGNLSQLGGGAYSVTITVDDGSDPLENATVRMKASAGNDNVGSTDANGQVTFSLDAATYTVTITLSGYSFTSTTLAVSAAASQTYSMTAVTITPSTGSQTTCYTTCYDEDGVVESGVTVYCVVRESAYHDTGILMDSTERSETSAANGVVQFSGLFKGVTYGFRRGTSANELLVKIPTDAGTTYELPSFYGGP